MQAISLYKTTIYTGLLVTDLGYIASLFIGTANIPVYGLKAYYSLTVCTDYMGKKIIIRSY